MENGSATSQTGTHETLGLPPPAVSKSVSAVGRPELRTATQRTILIALPYAVNVRDVLRTDVLRTLKAAGHRIVLLSPAHDDPAFQKEFSDTNVYLEPLYPYVPGKYEFKHHTLRTTLFSDLTETLGAFSSPRNGRSLPKRVALSGLRLASKAFGRKKSQQFLAAAGLMMFPEHRYDQIFARYKPDLVCLTRVFGTSADHPVLKTAARLKVPTVLLVSSWDNLTSKGVFPARVDRVVVWNSVMAEEACVLHGIDPELTYVAGAPQFDIYADPGRLPDRETFFRRIGADPAKALVTFALQNPKNCPDELDVLDLLWEDLRDGKLGRPCQLLARVHPLGNYFGDASPKRLQGRPGLLFDTPGKPSRYIDRDPGLEDMKHLAATMLHSDVVINTSSTIAIDAAALDTPIICAAFDGRRELPYERSVRRHFDYTHYKKLLAMGGIRVARNREELRDHVNAYLADPNLDREGRKRIVERQCFAIDGKAGERIGSYVLRALDDLVPTR